MSDSPKKATTKKAATKKAVTKKAAGSVKKVTKKAPAAKATSAKSASAPRPVTAERSRAENAPASRFFRLATERARRIVVDPRRLRELSEKALRSSAFRSDSFASVLDDFRALIRLVVAYARGLYRQIPVDKLVVVVAGLLYVVSPLDLIPDALPIAGFLDDAAVIGWVIKAVREELDAFREWESGLTD